MTDQSFEKTISRSEIEAFYTEWVDLKLFYTITFSQFFTSKLSQERGIGEVLIQETPKGRALRILYQN